MEAVIKSDRHGRYHLPPGTGWVSGVLSPGPAAGLFFPIKGEHGSVYFLAGMRGAGVIDFP
jgi:hypothetical protein